MAVLPCVLPRLHIYLSLTDSLGFVSVGVACVTADSTDELFRGRTEVFFFDPLQVVELQYVFPNALFLRLEKYRFRFTLDEQLLRERKFFVAEASSPLA